MTDAHRERRKVESTHCILHEPSGEIIDSDTKQRLGREREITGKETSFSRRREGNEEDSELTRFDISD